MSSAISLRNFLPSLAGLGFSYSDLPRTYVLGFIMPPLRGWSFVAAGVRLVHKAALTRLLRSLGRQGCHNGDVLQQVLGQAVALL